MSYTGMASDPVTARTKAELELVDSERFHLDEGTHLTTTRMMTEVVMEGNNTYNPAN